MGIAIGGIINLSGEKLLFSDIKRIGEKMAVRASSERTAFFEGNVGVACCGRRENISISRRDKKSIAVAVDSDICAAFATEKYFVGGSNFADEFKSDFAIAVYDGAKGTLTLACQRDSTKPLFWRQEGERIIFSSVIDALYLDSEHPKICREAVKNYILAPIGSVSPTLFIDGVQKVRSGQGICISSIGTSSFSVQSNLQSKESGTAIRLRYIFNRDRLSEYLCDSLLCFGVPMFDCSIPYILNAVETARECERGELVFFDTVRRYSRRYADMRDERLSALYGVKLCSVFDSEEIPKSYLDNLWESLCALFFSEQRYRSVVLRHVFGRDAFRELVEQICKKSEDTEAQMRNIRILGMLYQLHDYIECNGAELK